MELKLTSISGQEDCKSMEETMWAKMEEGFRSEQQARQQAKNEMMDGLKNEENTRQLVQRDLAVMKGGDHFDNTRSSFQGNTDEEVVVFIVDLQKIIPGQFHQHIDCDQSRKEQGNWPTKTIVNMWFKNETNLAAMIGLQKL